MSAIDTDQPLATPEQRKSDLRPLLVQRGKRDALSQLLGSRLDDNPARHMQKITAKQSAAVANHIILSRDTAFYDLMDEMGRRPPILGALKKILSFLMGLDQGFRFDNEEDAEHPRADEILEATNRFLFKGGGRFNWESMRRNAILGYIKHGFNVHGVTWESDGQLWFPTAYHGRHPAEVFFTTDGLPVWVDDPIAGELTDREPIPLGLAIIFGDPGEYSNPFGQSIIEPLQPEYAIRNSALKDWLKRSDQFGMPFAKATIKDGGGSDSSRRDNMQNLLNNMSEADGVVLGEGEELEFVDRDGGTSQSPHEGLVNYLDRVIVRTLLGAHLQTMESEFGTRAQAITHEAAEETELKPVSQMFVCGINAFLVEPFIEFNFGPNAPRPVYYMQTADEVDIASNRETLKLANDLGMPVAEIEAYDMMSLKIPADDEKTIGEGSSHENDDETGGSSHEDSADMSDTAGGVASFQFLDEDLKGTRINRILENKYIERLIAVQEELVKSNIQLAGVSIGDALRRLRDRLGPNTPMPVTALITSGFDLATLDADLELALTSVRALGFGVNFESVLESLPEFRFTPNTGSVRLYEAGINWMLRRDIIAQNDFGTLIKAVAQSHPIQNELFVERLLRDRMFVISEATRSEVVRLFQLEIATSIERGTTVNDFISRMNVLLDEGDLASGARGYLQNVYRTESAAIYAQARKEAAEDPDIADHLWGWEVANPDDPRSRESHADLDGLLLKRNSAADTALGTPPFSYQCRCDKVPIYVDDLSDPGIEESENAGTLVAAVERFSEDDAENVAVLSDGLGARRNGATALA